MTPSSVNTPITPNTLASIIILSLTCTIFALACGQDEGTQPEGDSTQIVSDAGPTPTADSAPAQDAAPTPDGAAQPTPDGAAPPPDTFNKPDTAPPPDAKLPPDAAPCNTALQGSYSGPFSLTAVEKLGSSVINKMACSGTLTATMTCGQLPVLQGSYTCNYSGGLVIFDKKQTGTIQGKVDMGGAFTGQIKHSYNSSLKKTYAAAGSITGGKLAGSGKGSLYPNPKSVVAWKVDFTF